MKRILVIATLLVLAGCANNPFSNSTSGKGFGSGEDDYKESPCACLEIKQKYKSQYQG